MDQYDGPSALITLSPVQQSKMITSRAQNDKGMRYSSCSNIYNEERKTFYRTFGSKKFFESNELGGKTGDDSPTSGGIKTSRQQFKEFESLRNSLKEFQEMKATK